jgi:hypothetical protein
MYDMKGLGHALAALFCVTAVAALAGGVLLGWLLF